MFITLICQYCKEEYSRQYKYRNVAKFCSKECSIKAHSGSGNPMYGRTAWTKTDRPDIVEKIIATMHAEKVNIGDSNGMKNPEARARMSKTRREKVTSSLEYREKSSVRMREAWANGKYDQAKVGTCKWFRHIKPDGSEIKVQGSWEKAYAEWLDLNHIQYEAHPYRLKYIDDKGKLRSYFPDFLLLEKQIYIDVKNPYYVTKHASKIEAIRMYNPNIILEILEKHHLEEMGVL